MLGYCIFISRYFSNQQSCLNTTGLYDGLLFFSSLFHFFYFIFSAHISFSLCFPISQSLLFLMFFLKHLSSIVEKLLYTYIKIIYVIKYIRKLMNFPKLKGLLHFYPTYLTSYELLLSCSVVSDSLQPHRLQQDSLLFPSPSPRVCSNLCPLSQ